MFVIILNNVISQISVALVEKIYRYFVQWVKGNTNTCCVLNVSLSDVCQNLGQSDIIERRRHLHSHYHSDWASCSVQIQLKTQGSDGKDTWRNGELMFPYVPVFLFFFLKVSRPLEAHQGVDHASAGKGQEKKRKQYM